MSQSTKSVKMLKCGGCLCSYLLCIIFISTFATDKVKAQELRPPASEFNRHRLVQPTIHHGRTKREISTTKDTDGAHHSELTMKIIIDGEEYTLDLRLNGDLVPDNHVIRYQKNGKTVHHTPKAEDLDICQYSGTVRGKPDSWAALSTCRGVRGVIYDGKQMKYIQPAEGDHVNSNHYVYEHTDLNTSFHCGYKGGVTNNTEYDPLLLEEHLKKKDMEKSRVSRHKRSTYEDTLVRGPYNANKLSRYVELVLIADHGEFVANGEDLNLAHHQLKDVANIINAMYSPLNIFIALIGVVVWTEQDEIDLEEDGDKTLTKFLQYRKVLSRSMPNDNAQLLTRQRFKEGVVGKGLKGPICTYEFSGAVSTNHSEVIGLVAATIAHEMGHNFGMEHDTAEDCECPDEKCIMSPSSTSVVPVHWSSCSLKSLALAFEKGMDYCLRNKPKKLFESPTCGNGFVEAGEQCDCGTKVDKSYSACTACCRADVCLLRENATCATGACCDLKKCRPMSAGTVCRAAGRECDLPEYCSGASEFCPADVFAADGLTCGAGAAHCARGACRSRSDQCRLLWGTTGLDSNDRCYTQNNAKGTVNGNCGYDRVRQVYRACAAADVRCGLLQCRHLNERLEFGMESVSTLSQMFINNHGTIIPCRTAIIDLGLNDVDPGLVPDGAKCGENQMCFKQKCVSVDYVQALLSEKESSVCPSNCSGHGICNSEGHCHCEPGFGPPLCALPGPGGSVDSGPATDPTVQRNFMVTMYVVFLGIIPALLVVLFLIYYTRHNVLFWKKKSKKSMPSPKKTSLPSRISRSASKFASNFQNHSQNNPQPVVHTLPNPDDMSSSLLRSDTDRSPPGNINSSVNFFGNFKGFSLTPVEKIGKEAQEKDTKPEIVSINTNPKITPVHKSSSINQNSINQNNSKPALRSAPPLPLVPVLSNTNSNTSPSVKRTNSSVQNRIKSLISADKTDDATPTVTNHAPRPVISSPILEASTCTRKELISPLQGSKTLGPIRAAPTIPNGIDDFHKRPLSMHSTTNVLNKPLPDEPKKVKEGISLNRIASFLKQDKPKEKERKPVERSHSMPKNPNHQVKVPKVVDKVALRNLQISNPILQKDIDLPVSTVPVVSDSEDTEDPKAFVNRAQSMRAPIGQKTTIQSFGSMRKAPVRPLSIVGRPTAPPPPLPSMANSEKLDEIALYQNPKRQTDIKQTDYVDCIEEKPAPLALIDESSGENIYTIIEESPIKHVTPIVVAPPPISTIPQIPPEGYNTPKPITSASGSSESMGLLGEIVNEIQNRNFESIYSASTLSRKKKEREKKGDSNRDSTYMNTDYKTPESIYSNSGAKSSAASTTSSGYLHPSAVNIPTYMNKQNNTEIKEEEPPASPSLKGVNSKIPTFSRQITPPIIKNTSTFRNVPQSPKNTNKNGNISKTITNSPDVVSSCVNETKNTKPPDVINNNKLPAEINKAARPNVAAKPIDNRPLRPAPTVDKKPAPKTIPSLKPVNSSSNLNKNQNEKHATVNRTNSKVDANVKSIADNLNKNKPKFPPKPTAAVHRTDSNIKPAAKLTAKPSNVANLQQKFENRKSFGKDNVHLGTVKK